METIKNAKIAVSIYNAGYTIEGLKDRPDLMQKLGLTNENIDELYEDYISKLTPDTLYYIEDNGDLDDIEYFDDYIKSPLDDLVPPPRNEKLELMISNLIKMEDIDLAFGVDGRKRPVKWLKCERPLFWRPNYDRLVLTDGSQDVKKKAECH